MLFKNIKWRSFTLVKTVHIRCCQNQPQELFGVCNLTRSAFMSVTHPSHSTGQLSRVSRSKSFNSHVLREENVSLQRIVAIRNKYEAVILRTSLGIVNFLANYYERITFRLLLQSTISIMNSPINDFLFFRLGLDCKSLYHAVHCFLQVINIFSKMPGGTILSTANSYVHLEI